MITIQFLEIPSKQDSIGKIDPFIINIHNVMWITNCTGNICALFLFEFLTICLSTFASQTFWEVY